MDDSSNFPAQRRNLILMSLAIILFIHAGGKITDHFRVGFVPLVLHNPRVVLHFAILVFIYFCYRFWVCGGRHIVRKMRDLKARMIKGAYPSKAWKEILKQDAIAQLKPIYEGTNLTPTISIDDFKKFEDPDLEEIEEKKVFYLSSYGVTYQTDNKDPIKTTFTYKFIKHPSIFFRTLTWAFKSDSTLSDYLVPFALAIYALIAILIRIL